MPSPYKNLFLRQSYLDCYTEYEKSLCQNSYAHWDYIVLTASNEAQAQAYEQQIRHRLKHGKLPKETHYAVLPDPDGKRVGSGGATLNVMRYIAGRENTTDFTGRKILLIHSGGDSKRVPQYSACGKLFSPVPRTLPDGRRSTLFDEYIICMSSVPSRMTDGMLVCSGDVLLLFNPLQIDCYCDGAVALSIKEDVETGKDHGVFLGDADGNVGRFLHKQTVEKLTQMGAVDAHHNVNIDIGAVILNSRMLNSLYELIRTPEQFRDLVNEHVRLSFYADFLYPLASESTLEEYYKEIPEGEFSDELTAARTRLWEILHPYRMKLIRFSPAAFIHFGTTRELLSLVTEEMDAYKFLDWSGRVNTNSMSTRYAASNSYICKDAAIGDGSYIEDSWIDEKTVIGKRCVISGVTLKNAVVKDNTVLHGLKFADGRFAVRMYGVDDNPKECRLFGHELSEPLWTAPLYPVCDTMEEAVIKTLKGEMSAEMISLKDSFNRADVTAILPWQSKLDDKVRVESLLCAIDSRVPVKEAVKVFHSGISERAKSELLQEAERLSVDELEQFSRKIRIYYYLSRLVERDRMSDLCFGTICDAILGAAVRGTVYNPDYRIVKDEVVTRLPVRVNWGGGWSDTPPYCMEHGGMVLNAAITLDGRFPIEAVLRRVPGSRIVLASADNGSYKEFTEISELQDCRNPSDVFALHKAALIACGVIPYRDAVSVEEITGRLGGGLYLSTQVINIPRGSGLGTSSILAGACVKGIYEFLGVQISENDLYNRVLCMEQIMSTGGGWQDQVGGLARGIKMVTAEPGLKQKVTCTPVNIGEAALKELDERFAVIYTGQRRLARNLLREVVGRYIGGNETSLEVLYEIQRIAVLMRFELEKGNVDGFAKLLSEHWELSKKLDSGCTNTCIDQIFLAIDDLIDGKMICGAGGGGFLQVILKKGIGIEELKERLNEVFADSGVGAWNCSFWC